MTITDFATLGIVGCLLALIAIVDDWGSPMLQKAGMNAYERKVWNAALTPQPPIEPKRPNPTEPQI